MEDNLFEWACKEIDTEEKKLGHQYSWRFLLTSSRTLSSSSRIAFIALNPAGDKIPIGHGKESCENGCAIYSETWESPIQDQVKELFNAIAKRLDVSDKLLMDNSLMAYYIPFRSKNFKDLVEKEKSCDFAYKLWEKILKDISPELIITIDRQTFKNINNILINSNKLKKVNNEEFKKSTGWGNINASINYYVNSRGHIVVVRFPHFSRFKIFSHPQSKPYIKKIVTEMTRFMI